MSIENYLNQLDRHLKDLNDRERREALSYYREYAREAGLQSGEQMEQRFGTPKELASTIYAESILEAHHGQSHPARTMKLSLAALALFPFSFPLAIAAFAILFSLSIALFAIFVSFFAVIVSFAAASVYLFFHSFPLFISLNLSGALKCLGGALVMASLTVIAFTLISKATHWIMNTISTLIARFVQRRKENE